MEKADLCFIKACLVCIFAKTTSGNWKVAFAILSVIYVIFYIIAEVGRFRQLLKD